MTKEEIKILGEIFSRISLKTYEELGSEFKEEKDNKLELEKKFSLDLSIEERAKLDNKYIDEASKEEILYIISCLKDPKYSFVKNDIDKLTTFVSKLNFILRGTSPSGKGMADRMNNIKNGLIKEGKLLELDVLFNEFKNATSWKLFKEDTSIDSAFFNKTDEWKYIYLFSNCKNCQDKINYPLYYAAWQVIADWCFKVKTGDYDAFCEYYRELDFLGNEKQLNFCCYYELLRLKLRNDEDYTKFLDTLDDKKRKEILEEIRETEVKDNEGMPIDESNLEEQIMDTREKFKKWLDSRTDLAPNTINQYKSQIDTVNDISEKNQLGDIFSWTKVDWETQQDLLLAIPLMVANSKRANPKGSGVYSASLSKLKEFFDLNNVQEKIDKGFGPSNPPSIPCNEFCWYWASTGVSEWNNDPLKLFVICKSIYENGNGNPTYTSVFKDFIESIAINNGVDATTAYEWSQKAKQRPDKNILLDNSFYWFNLNLIYVGPNPATLTIDTINSLSSLDVFKDLLRKRIVKYELPNYAILNSGPTTSEKENRIKCWSNFGKFIHPFKIIAKIFKALETENVSQRYLTNDELCRIIIPLSAVQADTSTYIENILRFRSNPSDYASWPKPQDSFNNGDRMANEYLLFLEMMGHLNSNKPAGSHKAPDKKYQIVDSDSLDFILSEINSNQETPESTEDNYCKSLIKPEFKENKIFFGAPGTGKSYEISQTLKQRIPDKQCRDKFVFRVTFHPEYDHASFLGGYKPYSKDGAKTIEYKFIPQIFTNVFVKACNDPNNQYYLIIEEINRGNCAEIFGDLFQLLDRNLDYPINTSRELTEFLNGKDENDNKIIKNSKFWDENGKMLLPDNITLWATMNTSDQSLMPMDSAFKRRWKWQYIPIIYTEKDPETKKDNTSFKYKVQLENSTETFSWIEFIEKINSIISKIDSLGMDKCLGNYFVQVDKNDKNEYLISEDTFINKVLFYLWNDVFKDENDEDGLSIFKGMTFMDFFPKANARINIKKILDVLAIKFDNDGQNEHTENINEVESQESDSKITETKAEE
jgi:hypothetical protein